MGGAISQQAASQQTAIMPRISSSLSLLRGVISGLKKERAAASCQNAACRCGPDGHCEDCMAAMDCERRLRAAEHALARVARQMASAGRLDSVPELAATAASLVRGVSSMLYCSHPQYSSRLCEISSALGSVLADSASITEATFDFRRSNRRSAQMLEEARLAAEARMGRLYPGLKAALAA